MSLHLIVLRGIFIGIIDGKKLKITKVNNFAPVFIGFVNNIVDNLKQCTNLLLIIFVNNIFVYAINTHQFQLRP